MNYKTTPSKQSLTNTPFFARLLFRIKTVITYERGKGGKGLCIYILRLVLFTFQLQLIIAFWLCRVVPALVLFLLVLIAMPLLIILRKLLSRRVASGGS